MLVIDGNRRVLDERVEVDADQLASTLGQLRTRFGADARLLVDGTTVDESLLAHIAEPVQVVTHGGAPNPVESVTVAHTMLWDTYDRAAQVQSWMLEQASTFTLDLLRNNKRLADQASEMQKRYQAALAELDLVNRDQKLMEAEEAASRYSRHLIEKAKAEIAAAVPPRSSLNALDDIIEGAAIALGAIRAQTGSRGPGNKN